MNAIDKRRRNLRRQLISAAWRDFRLFGYIGQEANDLAYLLRQHKAKSNREEVTEQRD